MAGKTATAHTDVDARREEVWAALTEPATVKRWMMGSDVETDWQVGSPITWHGEYEGTSYEDTGEVVTYDEPDVLSVTHFSPLMGEPDVPASYHTLVWTLTDGDSGATHVEMTQDGCDSDEQAEQFSRNWQAAMDALRQAVEG